MMSDHFILEDPTDTSSRYARRIPQSVWSKYKNYIQKLHETGLTRRQILEELSKHDFHPSFGQLVATMTRWRLVRYSKPPLQSPDTTTTTFIEQSPRRVATRTGICRLTQSLLNVSLPTYKSLNMRASDLHPKNENADLQNLQNSVVKVDIRHPDTAWSAIEKQITEHPPSLYEANILFLGESYAEAFQAYWTVVWRGDDAIKTLDTDQVKLQAIIGCLKSAATEQQHSLALHAAQTFLIQLFQYVGELSNPPFLSDVFDKWYNRDCALAKVLYDLITTYKRLRPCLVPTQAYWVEDVTIREWTCSRLVRLPTWEEAMPFLDSHPTSEVHSSHVFDAENLQKIFAWAEVAVDSFGSLYDTQVQQSQPWSFTSSTPQRILLFWRFKFFAKYSRRGACPSLKVRLSSDTHFVASCKQTMAILSRVLLSNSYLPEEVQSHVGLLQSLKQLRSSSTSNETWGSLWRSMREVLAPSFCERFQTIHED